MNKRDVVIGIDLGAKCGVAVLDLQGRVVEAYTQKVSVDLTERVEAVDAIMDNLHSSHNVFLVAYEIPMGANVRSLKSLYGMMGMLISWCVRNKVSSCGENVTALKKHATGKGNADKAAMIAAVKDKWGIDCDDNTADALHVAAWGLSRLED